MPNNNSITKFKDGFKGGSRPNRFEVEPAWPSKVARPTDTSIKIISASLPQAKINTIGIPYRGRTITYAGDRSYTPWTIGIYDDNNTLNLWKAFQNWKELLDGHYNHRVDSNDFDYSSLQTTWKVHQYDLNGTEKVRTIKLYKCWPNVVGEINLNMGETNFVAFNVSLTFDYMEISKGIGQNNAQY
jgi:hypothetical protein